MTRIWTQRRHGLEPGRTPAVATLDDALWRRVGAVLVARGRLSEQELEATLAEQRQTRVPLDELLIRSGRVGRQEIASLVLVCQLGGAARKRLRVQLAKSEQAPTAQVEPATEVPVGPVRTFKLACIAVDVAMLMLATLAAAWSRAESHLAYPPVGWVLLFALLTVALYWAWRLYTFRTTLRPLADALLIAGASGLAAMLVLSMRSLGGTGGVTDAFLPLWAFAAVYGVTGRFALYLWWTVWAVRVPEPAPVEMESEPAPRREPPPSSSRHMAVVPLRPEMWGLLEELRHEVDALTEGRRAASR